MFRIELGSTRPYCDGLSRRSFLQVGMTGLATGGLGQLLRAREVSAGRAAAGKDKSVILLWLDGGPGHMDLYDLKPEAPAEYRGIWRPIPTNVPGIEISELFPLQARLADKFSIVRSLHHDNGDHFTGGHWMLTGRDAGVSGAATAGKFPFFGAVAGKVLGPRRPGLPATVAVPYAMSIGLRPGYFGAQYLGVEHDPFETSGDPNAESFQVQNLALANPLTIERLEDRRSLVRSFDSIRRDADSRGVFASMDRFDQQAYELVTSEQARRAFEIGREDPRLRDTYGRHTWGQSTLLARRLVEAGARFVTCHFGGWDHHWNLQQGMENYLPIVDRAVSGLLADLDQRGLLDQVLVMLCGEFSRTPRMNDGGNGGAPGSMGTPGRDHWGNAMFCFLAGGGLKGGQVIGSTTRLGEAPQERPLRPGDIHHTVFHVLGIDPEMSFIDHAGRPIPAIDHGEVIRELV
jgi:Protein of unknown function (DUF1501)